MKLSIVIPTYNSEKYLDKCLQSIFSQSYKDFEVIVIDAYSSDLTQVILAKYPKDKLQVILRKPQGEPDAINAGMELATGDIVTYIDADDTYEPECFMAVVCTFMIRHDLQWLFGIGKVIDSNGNECRNTLTKIKQFFWSRYTYNNYLYFNYIVQPTVFMKREFYNKVGKYNTDLKYVFDYDYYIRAGKLSKPMFVNWHLANWRSHSSSVSGQAPVVMAKQALELQGKYSSMWFRPIQWLAYIVAIVLYGSLKEK